MSGPSSADLKRRVQTLAAKGDDSMFELAEALAELWALPKPPGGDRPTLSEPPSRKGIKSPMQVTSPEVCPELRGRDRMTHPDKRRRFNAT